MATITKRKSAQTGKISFLTQVRLKGYRPEVATFTRLTDARKWASRIESDMREGRHFNTVEARRRTVADLIIKYRAEIESNSTHVKAGRLHHLDWWNAEIGHLTLADLKPTMLAEYRDKLRQKESGAERTPATINRYLATLSHALSQAVKEWGWLETSPMTKLRRKKEPLGRVRFLSDDERESLLKSCRAVESLPLYPIVVLALSTGMRQGEILGLTWADMDLQRGWIVLHHTKNNDRRGLPLVGHALEVLKDHAKVRRIDTAQVFPDLTGNTPAFRKAWGVALKEAKIENFRFHDLRHSAASYLAMGGASLTEIADVLGHRTLAMVKRYAHIADDHRARVVSKMNESIFSGQAQ